MNAGPNIAAVAKLISEPSRAVILTALLDGRFHPASSLAYTAGIKPQTASFHLKKMIEANVVRVEKHGRHRYYGLENYEVAEVLESLLSLAPKVEVKSFKQATNDKAIRYARTCYDHLAGQLGVKMTDSLLDHGFLEHKDNTFNLTPEGETFFHDFEIDLEQVRKKRRTYIHKCLDWSERRHHIAGAVGNALLERLIDLKWIERVPTIRAVKVTTTGKTGLQEVFNIEM
ncbi:ArsR/SmtB family transcription factor [Pseudalkalibacillus salsuginis]|uniref:ArsR/SmtB family transcription factor n=1 Tax=Pseudalkalibacillus salsuginis TaxID=2910972 RepID=UPI001F24A614|nr:winged helix-turn-helix domain-containing protein [Pseudalkalibacillus salsuginis]MCF6409824.1 winged helix-turn-helix domain-containing protein [Pseudalkalibacillus salsuginis]